MHPATLGLITGGITPLFVRGTFIESWANNRFSILGSPEAGGTIAVLVEGVRLRTQEEPVDGSVSTYLFACAGGVLGYAIVDAFM